ncbi:MBL fold metallo-hydrolase [Clostridia bacterium]|nr:MBL fold metallo-hydrolase [Clostridia bacterium]
MRLITKICGGENTYVYFNEETKNGFVVDPGCTNGEDLNYIISQIESNGINVKFIFLTHGHFDHITGIAALREKYGVPVAAYAGEAPLLADPELNLSRMFLKEDVTVKVDYPLLEGLLPEKLTEGIAKLSLIHTPGHTAGCACLYDEADGILFSGDTLFFETIGRTDLPTSDERAIIKSIKEKLLVLPEETVVYSGHGQHTTIAHEKSNAIYN